MEQDLVWYLIAKKLSGEYTPDEQLQLEDILRRNPELHYSIQSIMDIWGHPSDSPEDPETGKSFERHLQRMKELHVDFPAADNQGSSQSPSRSFFHSRKIIRLSLVAVLALLCYAGLRFYYANPFLATIPSRIPEKALSEISTKNGSKTSIVLPDGSSVWLNAGSKLTYDKDYGNNIREVTLFGEAFFDVVKNKEKPFIIHTSKMDIKVLGTRFNVKSYPADKTTETTLIRGSIEVSLKDRASQKLILKPNEKLIISNDEPVIPTASPSKHVKISNEPIVSISHLNYLKKDSTVIETAWVQNKLVFKDQPFVDLASEMERWYSVSIRFEDNATRDLRFTGVFENESIQQALNALKLSGKFNYAMKNNEIIISK